MEMICYNNGHFFLNLSKSYPYTIPNSKNLKELTFAFVHVIHLGLPFVLPQLSPGEQGEKLQTSADSSVPPTSL